MAPTTLLGQKTSTTHNGRTSSEDGYPLRMAEMLAGLPGTALAARVAFVITSYSIHYTKLYENKAGEPMTLWEKVKIDLQKGIEEGMAAIKEGAAVVKEKAEELTEEGKRRYKIFEMKKEVHKDLAELGGKVYDLRSKMERNNFV